ncbi:MAG TPA: PAS domain-containing protein, partial [Methanomicrobiales archaeon]|nr:PAS domain-containing protein [Methanomicrobiales archaeon]
MRKRRKKGNVPGDEEARLQEAASRRIARPGEPGGRGALSNSALLHELQVHQVQLEMQNEALTRMQAELEESRNLYRDLYDSAPVGYLTLDHRTIVKGANRTAMALLGVSPGDLVLHGFGRFVVEPDLTRWDRHCRRVFGSGVKDSCVIRLKRPDDSGFTAQLESIRIGAAGGAEGEFDIRTILTDVSER